MLLVAKILPYAQIILSVILVSAILLQQSAAGLSGVVEVISQRRAVQIRNANPGHQTTDRQHAQREQNPGLQLRNFEAVGERVDDGAKHELKAKPSHQTADRQHAQREQNPGL